MRQSVKMLARVARAAAVSGAVFLYVAGAQAQSCADGSAGAPVNQPSTTCGSGLARFLQCSNGPDVFVSCVASNKKTNRTVETPVNKKSGSTETKGGAGGKTPPARTEGNP
ncbi:hypothetical protein [Sinorhizobium sp. BG8]|uniref:hypothetical protein n=1 Tax=Sinorhizobium sp. BG8 TaxID=2613773 RepID=UPI00193E5685|nr:hypothetical protein [Sinorhizobium sp. BG8]QRM55734.1 hypothetical protein F3Y30_15265 [Sinorhizobium sp. BG8]